jgi:membrane fusion protein (multidrug efflux system)
MTDTKALVSTLGLLLVLTACNSEDGIDEVEFRVPVSVRDVERGTVENLVVATGTLRSPESALLKVESAGLLTLGRSPEGRRWAEGDQVNAGQVIGEISGEEVRLSAGTAAARMRFESTEKVLESRQELYQSGLISEEELRNAETQVAEAQRDLDRSRLTEARTQIVTPISGVILSLVRDAATNSPLADGQRVEMGFLVARVAPIERLVADIDLVGLDLALVREGLEARLRHYAWEDETFPGRLVRLAPEIDPTTRTLRAEVTVGNGDRKLRPGMFVEVTLVAERREDVLVIPREAVTERGGARVVFVINGQRVARREVGLGLGDDDVVEVRQGLEGEERIVVRGLETLTDGTPVRVTG